MSKKRRPPDYISLPGTMVWFYALVSVFVLPLVYSRKVIDSTLTPKFILLASLLLLFCIVLIYKSGKHQSLDVGSVFRQWPVLSWAAFLLLSVLSLLVAYNPWEGIFDVFRAGLSLIFLILTTMILQLGKTIRPFLLSAMALTAVMVVVGFGQYFAHVFGATDLQALYKMEGLFSHKNVFSGILFLMVPMLSYPVLRGNRWEAGIAGLLLGLDLTLLMVLQTRSLWLAVIVFTVVLIVLLWMNRRRWSVSGKLSLPGRAGFLPLILLVAIIAGSSLTHFSLQKASHSEVAAVQPRLPITGLGERAASIFDNQTDNRQKRIVIWRYTLRMISDAPLLGVGAGNWKLLAPGYYDPDYMKTYYHNWRRPHNDFLLVLAEKGVPGLLAFLGFFLSAAWYALRVIREQESPEKRLLVILAAGGIAGFMVDALFAFPYERIDIQMFLMLFVSAILWAMPARPPAAKAYPRNKSSLVLSAFMVFLLVALLLGRKWALSEVYTNKAYAYSSHKMWQAAIQAIDKGYSPVAQIDPSNGPVLWFRGKAYLNLGNLDKARSDLEKAHRQNPYAIRVKSDLGVLYGMMGDHERALEVLKEAHAISPTDRMILMNLGLAWSNLGRDEEALDCLYQCLRDQEDPVLNEYIRTIRARLYGPEEADFVRSRGSSG